MIRQFKHQEITWVDVSSPTQEELAVLSRDYHLHSLVENELASRSDRSRLDIYENYLYLILHFPPSDILNSAADGDSPDNEINFIIGHNFIISIHYNKIQTLDEFSQIFEATFSSENNKKQTHAGYLFFHILRQLYQSLDKNLELLNNELKRAEKNIFAHQEKEMVLVLADINHKLFDFRWSLKPHAVILSQLEDATIDFFGSNFRPYSKSLINAHYRITGTLESLQEMFGDLRITNDSLLSTKTNEIMKILTILAFVTFPLSVFTSIFGMNTEFTPLIGRPYDFWIIAIIMLAAVVAMFAYFRFKKWF